MRKLRHREVIWLMEGHTIDRAGMLSSFAFKAKCLGFSKKIGSQINLNIKYGSVIY